MGGMLNIQAMRESIYIYLVHLITLYRKGYNPIKTVNKELNKN